MEVKSPRVALWLYEFRYTLAKFRNYKTCLTYSGPNDVISTKFGTFKVRLNTSDAINTSPAFERRDMNYLLNLIQKLNQKEAKRVLFVDVGSDLGTYAITVANRFKESPVSVICFEPMAQSYSLILENCDLNRIQDKISVYPFGLLDEDLTTMTINVDDNTPGSSSMMLDEEKEQTIISIQVRTLDAVLLNSIKRYDAIVLKIDVEGVEQEVLRGAAGVLATCSETYLMVEDFIEPSIIGFLEQNGWSFEAKVTTYNSWWSKKP